MKETFKLRWLCFTHDFSNGHKVETTSNFILFENYDLDKISEYLWEEREDILSKHKIEVDKENPNIIHHYFVINNYIYDEIINYEDSTYKLPSNIFGNETYNLQRELLQRKIDIWKIKNYRGVTDVNISTLDMLNDFNFKYYSNEDQNKLRDILLNFLEEINKFNEEVMDKTIK